MRTPLTVLLALSTIGVGSTALQQAARAQGTAQVFITGIPPVLQSPFVADFEQDYQNRRFQMQFVYGGTQSTAFRFIATMSKEGQTLFSTTSSPTLFKQGTYLYNHFSDDPSISFPEGFDDLIEQLTGSLQRQIIESGAFPEGFYSVRIEAVPEDPTALITSIPGLASFSVVYPEPPRLLAVADQETLTNFHPIFSWTPVIAPPGAVIEYEVLIAEVLAGQSSVQALQGNRAHANVTLSGQTTFPYIASHLPFEAGKTYVWQVSANAELSGQKLPLKDGGRSEFWTFSMAGEKAADTRLEVAWVDPNQELVFTAGSRAAMISYSVLFEAPAGETFTPDTYVLHWSDPQTGDILAPIQRPIPPGDTQDQDYWGGDKATTFANVTLSESEFDQVAGPLGMGSFHATKKQLILELRGKDSQGNPVVGQTNWIPVELRQSEYLVSVAWVDPDQELVFTAGSRAAMISYSVLFEAPAGETFTPDTYVLHWSDPQTGDILAPMQRPIPPGDTQDQDYWGGDKVTTFANITLSESEFEQVAGPLGMGSFYTTKKQLILELRGEDSQGNPVVGQTNWIPVELRQSEYLLSVAWVDPDQELVFTAGSRTADISYNLTFEGPVGETFTPDTYVLHWADPNTGEFLSTVKKLIPSEDAKLLAAGGKGMVFTNLQLTESEFTQVAGPLSMGTHYATSRQLILEIQGTDSQGNPVVGQTNWIPVELRQSEYLLSVAWVDPDQELVFTAGSRAAMISYSVLFEAPAGETFTPDTYVLHWSDPQTGDILAPMQRPIPPGDTQDQDYWGGDKATTFANVTLTKSEFDQVAGPISVGEQSRQLILELRGKDSQGNPVVGQTNWIPVELRQSAYDLTVTWLDPLQQAAVHSTYHTGDVSYRVTFDAPADATFALDTFVYHWYDDGNVHGPIAPMEKPIIPEQSMELKGGENQTIFGQVVLSASQHKELTKPGRGNLSLVLELRGKDAQGNPVTGKTPKQLPVALQPALIVKAPPGGKLELLPATRSAPMEHEFTFTAAGETFTPDYTYALNWKEKIGGTVIKTTESPIPDLLLKPYAEGTHTLQSEIVLDQTEFEELFPTAGLTRYLSIELRGTDSKSKAVTGFMPTIEVTLAESAHELYVKWTNPDQLIQLTPLSRTVDTQCDITFAGPETESFTLDTYVLHWYDTYGKALPPTEKSIPVDLVASYSSGSWQTVPAKIELSEEEFDALLGADTEAVMRKLRLELRGKDNEGKLVTGITTMALLDTEEPVEAEIDVMFSSDTGQIDDTEVLVATAGYYELIPNVAFVQALENLTEVTPIGNQRKLDGVVRLVLIPKPFNSMKVPVDAKGLLFSPVAGKKDHWEIKGGLLSESGTETKPDLFRLYWDIVRVNKISYNHARSPNPMLIDKAEAHLPVLGKGVYLTDLVIDKNGLQLKSGEADINAFGWTFRIKDIQHKSAATGTEFSFTTGLRRGQTPISHEFAEATFKAKSVGGKMSVDIAVSQDKPFQLIPNTNYLNLTAVDFDYTSSDDWIMRVDVQSNDLPLMSKLGPLGGRLEYERSGKLRGMLEFIPRETSPGMPSADNTWFALGKWAKVDLTYAGVQFASTQTTTGTGDKEWDFDASQSKIQIAADLYLPPFGDTNNRVAMGKVTADKVDPGIWVDFNGDVGMAAVTVAQDRKLDLGPVHLKIEELYVKAMPSFEIGFGGALGVDAGGVVKSHVSIKNLKLYENGELNFDATEVVQGAEFTIVEVLTLGVKDISFSGSPETLKLAGKGEELSVTVDSYFRLQGAKLDIPGSGSGEVEDLVVYEKDGNTSFAIRGAILKIEDLLTLNLDFRYFKDASTDTDFLSAGGKAVFGSTGEGKAKATDSAWGISVYGNVGQRNGLDYWGFYAMFEGEIPLGPVNLTQVGGGFFWNPVQEDIDAVTKLSGFQDPKLLEPVAQMKPASTDPMQFAVMLTGGVSIGQKNFFKGSALVTVTGSLTKLNLKASALADFAEGTGYLLVNYNPAYVVGDFQVQIAEKVPLVKCAKSNLTFYHYPDLWGVMGRIDVGLFASVISTTAEVYVGSDGFLFDFTIKKELDIYVISGGLSAEVMAWYRQDVSWGAWAQGKAYGELLYGLVGGEVGLEGAFIGKPESVVFLAGHLKVEILYMDVFSGRVWISIGENGFDSGTGKNAKYDGIIADARNTGKEMKADMDKLAEDLKNAQNALFTLSDQEAAAAGTALIYLMEIPGFDNYVKSSYQQDIDMVAPGSRPTLSQALDVIFNPRSRTLGTIDRNLSAADREIDAALSDVKEKETQVTSLLNKSAEVISGKLPSVQEAGSSGSPVGEVSTITVECIDPDTGATKMCVRKAGFAFDGQKASQQETAARNERADSEAYRKQLADLAHEYSENLKSVENLLSGSGLSVNTLIGGYAKVSRMIGSQATGRLELFRARVAAYDQQRIQLSAMGPQIIAAIEADVVNPVNSNQNKALRRRKLQGDLVQLGKLLDELGTYEPQVLPVGISDWAPHARTSGINIWYSIPKAGFDAIVARQDAARLQFAGEFQKSNNMFQAQWNTATATADRLYRRKVELYTLLYDLLDRLSLLAGTRQETPAPTGGLQMGVPASVESSSYPPSETTTLAQAPGQQPTGQQQDVGALLAQGVIKPSAGVPSWDYEKERLFVKQMLQVPQMTSFSGQIVSDRTPEYATLTLSWNASHPQGIAEYSLDIPGYSKPVKMPVSPKPDQPKEEAPVYAVQTVAAWAPPTAVIPAILYATLPADVGMTLAQSSGQATLAPGAGFEATPPTDPVKVVPADGQLAEQPTEFPSAEQPELGPVPTGEGIGQGPSIIHAWRSVADRTSSSIPFFRGVHDAGGYQVWLRARGAGGMTLERLATVNVDYAFAGETPEQDFGAPIKTDVLASADNTPPTKPKVDAVPTTKTATLLYASWNALDYESGIQEYQYRIVTISAGQVNRLTGWYSAGGLTEMNIKLDAPMTPGEKYYVQVRARNGAGNWSEPGMSAGTELGDPTPPTKPLMRRPALSSDSLLVSWLHAQDPESDVVGYRFAVGTRPQASDVIAWTHTTDTYFVVALDKLHAAAGEKPQPEMTAYVSICAVNGLGVIGPMAGLPVNIKIQTPKTEL